MSKFYHFHKNFTFKEMMNLQSYGTKNPDTLSLNQKITRLYRSTLRKIHATNLEGYRTEFTDYTKLMANANNDFYRMMELPAESHELVSLIKKYEDWQEKNYDPNMVIDECRPYASTSGRYPIWSDEWLKNDPYGFYSKNRYATEHQPDEHTPFNHKYPTHDSQWQLYDYFAPDFDEDFQITVPTKNEVEKSH